MVCPSIHRPLKLTVSHHTKRCFLATISTKQIVIPVNDFCLTEKSKNAVDGLYMESSTKNSLYVFLMDRILFCIL